MKLLVLIDNNTKNDNRVKRHIRTVSPFFDSIHVLARPLPDEKFGISLPRLTYSYFTQSPLTLDTKTLRDKCETLGVFSYIFTAFPAIAFSNLKNRDILEFCKEIQNRFISADWFYDVRLALTDDTTIYNDTMNMLCNVSFFIQWAEEAVKIEADTVYCNDLNTLLCGVAHKLKWNSRLIYDAHEISFDIFPGEHSKIYKTTLALMEYKLSSEINALIGVSQTQVDWLKKAYSLRIPCVTIPNCSDLSENISVNPKRPQRPLRLYYHGASDKWRGIEQTIEAIKAVPNIVLNLRCLESENLTDIKAYVQKEKISDKVVFLDPVSEHDMLMAVRQDADIGIHACDIRQCLNIKVALTNKFIEYLHAGIPVITSPLPEQARIVNDFDVGYVLKNNTPEEIARTICETVENHEKLFEMSINALNAYKILFGWSNYKDKLLNVVLGY